MKILVHACPARMWYVRDFLLPSLEAQGLRAEICCDTRGRGNLAACMDAFAALTGSGDTWHLQDDVLLCRDFAERIEALEDFSGIVCGFVNEIAGPDGNLIGTQPVADMWYSFPCIRIPDEWARSCAAWTYSDAERSAIANAMRAKGTGDDWFFREWATRAHPEAEVLNLTPCLVEHVDWLLGGSTVNQWRGHLSPAAYWDDMALTEELKKAIKTHRAPC